MFLESHAQNYYWKFKSTDKEEICHLGEKYKHCKGTLAVSLRERGSTYD